MIFVALGIIILVISFVIALFSLIRGQNREKQEQVGPLPHKPFEQTPPVINSSSQDLNSQKDSTSKIETPDTFDASLPWRRDYSESPAEGKQEVILAKDRGDLPKLVGEIIIRGRDASKE